MEDGVVDVHFQGSDAARQVVGLVKVGVALQVHDHAGADSLSGQAQGVQVDVVEVQVEVGCLHFPLPDAGFGAGLQA